MSWGMYQLKNGILTNSIWRYENMRITSKWWYVGDILRPEKIINQIYFHSMTDVSFTSAFCNKHFFHFRIKSSKRNQYFIFGLSSFYFHVKKTWTSKKSFSVWRPRIVDFILIKFFVALLRSKTQVLYFIWFDVSRS